MKYIVQNITSLIQIPLDNLIGCRLLGGDLIAGWQDMRVIDHWQRPARCPASWESY